MSETIVTGSQIGRYEVEAEVGRGGMGLVYRCYDPMYNRRVALKLMAAHLSDNANALARFHREASLVASLKHTHIAIFHEIGEFAARPYFVMEWVDGRNLKDELASHHKLPLARCLTLFAQLADAIDYAHTHSVVHRDLKPANIIIGPEDQATIVDFGVALLDTAPSLTTAGFVPGTPLYMSPEQIRGQDVDGRSDQYSLAVILYEMLTGQFPYESIRVPAIYHQQLVGQPIPITERDPTIPPAIEMALSRALSKEPVRRFSSMAEFNQALWRPVPMPTDLHREAHFLQPEPHWRREFGGEMTAVFTIGNDRILLATADGTVYMIDAASGETVWVVKGDGRITTLAYHLDTLYTATTTGKIIAWKANDGTAIWQYALAEEPGHLHVLKGQVLAVVLRVGELLYLNLQDGTEIKRVQLQPHPTAEFKPIFSGERLLLMSGQTLTAYGSSSKETD